MDRNLKPDVTGRRELLRGKARLRSPSPLIGPSHGVSMTEPCSKQRSPKGGWAKQPPEGLGQHPIEWWLAVPTADDDK